MKCKSMGLHISKKVEEMVQIDHMSVGENNSYLR
jgi:hypothetical protein